MEMETLANILSGVGMIIGVLLIFAYLASSFGPLR